MFKVEKSNCPVCEKTFTEDDDIVYCPQCGTPHHRECYNKTGHCINESLHNTGFNYVPQAKDKSKGADEQSSNGQASPKTTVCTACGTENDAAKLFCEKCGKPLGAGAAFNQNSAQPGQGMPGQGMFAPITMETMVAQIMPPNQEIDEIPAIDWATYIGNSAPYYLFQFKKQDDPNKRGLTFTWSALIMPVLYFLYRRMWGIAAIAAVITGALNTPAALSVLIENKIISLDISLSMLNNISYYCSIASLVVCVLCAFFAVTLFRKSAGRKLRKMKKNAASEAEYKKKLHRQSGPSKILLILLVIWLLLPSLLLIFGYGM